MAERKKRTLAVFPDDNCTMTGQPLSGINPYIHVSDQTSCHYTNDAVFCTSDKDYVLGYLVLKLADRMFNLPFA